MPHLFDTKPLIGWRIFNYGTPQTEDGRELFEIAAKAPDGVNPFEWTMRERLTGVGYQVAWPEGEPAVAHCRQGSAHKAPYAGCQCGLWGMHSIREAIKTAARYHTSILGRVAYWGHFLEHRQGFRAQFAYPQELIFFVPFGANEEWELEQYELAEKLGQQYAVETSVRRFKLFGRPRTKPTLREEHQALLMQLTSQGGIPWLPATSASVAQPPQGLQQFMTALAGAMPQQPFRWPAGIVKPEEFWTVKTVDLFSSPDYFKLVPMPPDLPYPRG